MFPRASFFRRRPLACLHRRFDWMDWFLSLTRGYLCGPTIVRRRVLQTAARPSPLHIPPHPRRSLLQPRRFLRCPPYCLCHQSLRHPHVHRRHPSARFGPSATTPRLQLRRPAKLPTQPRTPRTAVRPSFTLAPSLLARADPSRRDIPQYAGFAHPSQASRYRADDDEFLEIHPHRLQCDAVGDTSRPCVLARRRYLERPTPAAAAPPLSLAVQIFSCSREEAESRPDLALPDHQDLPSQLFQPRPVLSVAR